MLASPAVGWSLASLDDHGGTLSVPFDAHRFKIGRDELASTGAQELKFVSKEQCDELCDELPSAHLPVAEKRARARRLLLLLVGFG